MLEGLTPLGNVERTAPVRKQSAVSETAKTGPVERLLDPFPDTPPAEVLEALDHAQGVLSDLEARQVNLRFSVEPGSSKIHVKVLDGEGKLIREVPAVQALDVLSGGRQHGLGVDARG
jgi:hypothetical protein